MLYPLTSTIDSTVQYVGAVSKNISEEHKLIAAAHAAVAKETKDGRHHLNIHQIQLPASEKDCPKHFKCWSGEKYYNESVFIFNSFLNELNIIK